MLKKIFKEKNEEIKEDIEKLARINATVEEKMKELDRVK